MLTFFSPFILRIEDHEHMSPNDLKILKKGNEVGKLWYLQWSHGITLGGCGKKLKMFRTSGCVWFLQSETSPNKFHKVEKDPLGFSNNITVELVSEFQTFCIAIREHKLQHGKISYFSGAVCYLLIFFGYSLPRASGDCSRQSFFAESNWARSRRRFLFFYLDWINGLPRAGSRRRGLPRATLGK